MLAARKSYLVQYIILVVVSSFALVFILSRIPDQKTHAIPKSITYTFTQKDVNELGNSLLQAVNPSNPENAYMPDFMKEKILWLFNEAIEKRLELVFPSSNKYQEERQIAMQTYYAGGIPHVAILADHLITSIRVKEKTPSGFTQRQKNTFAMGLVHETVHLERPREYFEDPKKSEDLDEEFRTYGKVDKLVVSPLLKMGEPIDDEFIKLHEILLSCNYQSPCLRFQRPSGLRDKICWFLKPQPSECQTVFLLI